MKQMKEIDRMTMSRRQLLTASAGVAVFCAAGWSWSVVPARASASAMDEAIAEFTGGETPSEGRVVLTLPETAENGNTVPLTVSVESDMTEASHVEAVAVFADGNPLPGIATFHFSPRSGKAEVATRIRLAASQNVVAVARMNDGALFMDRRAVEVTVGGCVG